MLVMVYIVLVEFLNREMEYFYSFQIINLVGVESKSIRSLRKFLVTYKT